MRLLLPVSPPRTASSRTRTTFATPLPTLRPATNSLPRTRLPSSSTSTSPSSGSMTHRRPRRRSTRRSRRSSRRLPTPSCRSSTLVLAAPPVASLAVVLPVASLEAHLVVSLAGPAVRQRTARASRRSTKRSWSFPTPAHSLPVL